MECGHESRSSRSGQSYPHRPGRRGLCFKLLRSAFDGYPRGPESADIRARVARLLDSLAAGSTPPD